jgi:hypothetical protein
VRLGLHGAVAIVRDGLAAEPPAHCRLVSDHDRFEIVAWKDCTVVDALRSNVMLRKTTRNGDSLLEDIKALRRRKLTVNGVADTIYGI